MTDKAAVYAIMSGDEKALAYLINRYAAYVGTVIFNIIGNKMTQEDIEEAASDVFLVLWNNAGNFQAAKLKAWLGAVARNTAKNKLRKLSDILPLEEDYIAEMSENPEYVISEQEERQIMRHAVAQMKRLDREIFVRHYFGLQSVVHISEIMRMSESAVKLRLMRGREKIKKVLIDGGFIK